MNNKVIDFTYVLEKQKTFSKLLEDKKGIKQPSDIYNVPYSFILGLNSELYEIVNAAKMHKSYTKEKIDREHVIEECADLLSWIGNTANFLEIKLIAEVQEMQITAPEVIVVSLNDKINRLTWNKRTARYTLTGKILPLFTELIYSLGFDLNELKEAYHKKMDKNILEMEQGIWKN